MRRTTLVLYAAVVLLGGWACDSQHSPPENLIGEETYIDLIVEFQLLRSYQQSLPADSNVTDSLTDVIFEKYKISKDQYLRSQEYYQQDIEKHKNQLEKAIERLKIDHVEKDSITIPTGKDIQIN